MNEIEKYTQELINNAKQYLYKEYHLEALNLSDFQSVNFYLIDKAINNNENLFIESYDKELPALTQFPAVLSVTISLFFKNFCDDATTFKLGVVLQKSSGERYVYLTFKDGLHMVKNKTGIKYLTSKQLNKYAIVDAKLSDRKVKTRLTAYRKLYDLVFNIKNVPSQFKYKSAIIMSKKEFDNELKSQKYIDVDIKKAIPMRWIASSGAETWKHIPIEPMVYCVPDFDTLQTYVLDKGINIETLVVIGKNKYKDEVSTKIRLALRNEDISNCIVLGSQGFQDEQKQFLKWKWTYPEIEYLEKKQPGDIKIIDIHDKLYQESIDAFMAFIRKLETQNNLSLINVKRLRRFLYALVLSKHNNSRNISQLEFIKHLIQKVTSETIEQDFYDLGLDDYEVQTQVINYIEAIFSNFGNNKLKYLEQYQFVNYLIVPNRLTENWRDEFTVKNNRILSLKKFKKIQNEINGSKKVFVLSLYNNGMNYDEVLDVAINSKHHFSFLCYEEEAQITNKYLNDYQNSLVKEYQSNDRKKITGLDFKMALKEVIQNKTLEDIMDGFYNRNSKNERVYDYESNKQVNYRINFSGNVESLVYDGSKTVLLKKNGKWIKSKTYNVLPGDTVRVYCNLSKERLFEIALKEDNSNRFQEVEEMSKLWKNALSSYYSKRVSTDKYFDKDRLLRSLKEKGSNITNSITISKWLNSTDKERFPHSNNELKAIKLLVNDKALNTNYASLLRAKGFYRGLMISLGRDLSDDVMDFIISEGKHKGKMLSKFQDEEINAFVKSAAPVRTIESKTITEDEESNE